MGRDGITLLNLLLNVLQSRQVQRFPLDNTLGKTLSHPLQSSKHSQQLTIILVALECLNKQQPLFRLLIPSVRLQNESPLCGPTQPGQVPA
jgi:hypothetical protein